MHEWISSQVLTWLVPRFCQKKTRCLCPTPQLVLHGDDTHLHLVTSPATISQKLKRGKCHPRRRYYFDFVLFSFLVFSLSRTPCVYIDTVGEWSGVQEDVVRWCRNCLWGSRDPEHAPHGQLPHTQGRCLFMFGGRIGPALKKLRTKADYCTVHITRHGTTAFLVARLGGGVRDCSGFASILLKLSGSSTDLNSGGSILLFDSVPVPHGGACHLAAWIFFVLNRWVVPTSRDGSALKGEIPISFEYPEE